MRYLLIPTDNSDNNIPVEVPDDIIVNIATKNSLNKVTEESNKNSTDKNGEKIGASGNSLNTKTKLKRKKKIQTSRAYGETYNSNFKRSKSK